jgi:tetratricopeptide (TPR) repeat protein
MPGDIFCVIFQRVAMIRHQLRLLTLALGLGICTGRGQSNDVPLVQRQWFEIRTAHFNIYTCGTLQTANKLSARLEQFCEAYSLLASTQAVASPPIVVMAFPDEESMKPFLPLYQGKPGNLSGFFTRGSDENLIVLALPDPDSGFTGMDVIFHEYAHLLFRHNDQIWPLWLKEGMAEIYSTFETSGYEVQIARPIEHHLRLLEQQPLMPLRELFAVTHDSPQYNERERQGMFYAESWLLTHFLMVGDHSAYAARFGRLTGLLQSGQLPEQALTNALGMTLPSLEAGLRQYLRRGEFTSIKLTLPKDLSSSVYATTQRIAPVANYFRLGDELLRIGRLDDAESYFVRAQKLAPASPLPYEGLGLAAAQRGNPDEALRDMKEALQRGSTGFLAHYIYAREKYKSTADAQGRYAPLKTEEEAEIRNELQQSLTLMPNFAPAHELSGFFEMVQGENLAAAEHHLQLAIQLEPENPSYLLTLAQAQLRDQDPNAARRTLEPLLLPNVEPQLRAEATEMLQEIGRTHPSR